MKIMLLILRIFLIIAGLAVVGFGVLLAYLTITEFRPKPVEDAAVQGKAVRAVETGVPVRIVAWNIGYGSLGADADFFMDGGKTTRPASESVVQTNIEGVRGFWTDTNADIVLLQEVDKRSRRSYYVDETAYMAENWEGSAAFAPNYQVAFVPIPPSSPLGAVKSGMLTLNSFVTTESVRHSLPVPFKWPVSIANLKRCFLSERLPVSDADGKELIIVNVHLEAYTSGAGRSAQMDELMNFLKTEYEKGNYCVAGGDFNQSFPGLDPQMYRLKDVNHFLPGELSQDMLPEGWNFVTDTSVPSSRLLNEPYSGNHETTQLYAIDGYILSPNVRMISVRTADLGFRYSDHNPIILEISLQ